jgi:hypothetical protein
MSTYTRAVTVFILGVMLTAAVVLTIQTVAVLL